MKVTSIIAGSNGLSIILRSETPSGKGRAGGKRTPGQSKVAQPDSAEASAATDSAEGSAVASVLDALPAAPSDYNFYEGQAGSRAHMMTDYVSLLKSGMTVEGRFAQPCAFRYVDRQHVQAIAVQPTSQAVWQRMLLLDQWELDGIALVEAWLDLSKESQMAARQGKLHWCDAKHKLQNKNCRYQRSTDFYAQFFRDVRRASASLSTETGKTHPILFVDASCWNGESMVALLEDLVVEEQSGSNDAKPPIYGLFFDKKDVHYQVSRLRRDLRIKQRFMNQTLPLQGEQAKPCPKLLALREKSEHLQLKTLGVLSHSGVPCLAIPSEMDLPFMVKADLKRRLAELRVAYGDSAEKRRRIIPAGTSPAGATEMPAQIGLQALLAQYQILGRGTLCVESREVEVIQVGVESAGGSGGQTSSSVDASAGGSGDGASMPRTLYFFYLANPSARKQITLQPETLLTKGTRGTFYNRLAPDHEEIVADLSEKVALWQWSLTPQSFFAYEFGEEAMVGDWKAMYNAARAKSTTPRLTVYAHNVSDVAIKGKAMARAPRIHHRKQADIVVALKPHDRVFSVEKFGHLFLKEHVVAEGGVARVVWPVLLHEPGSVSSH